MPWPRWRWLPTSACGNFRLPPPSAPPPPKVALQGPAHAPGAGRLRQFVALSNQTFYGTAGVRRPPVSRTRRTSFSTTPIAVSGSLLLVVFALGAWWSGSGQRLRRIGAGWFLHSDFYPVSNLFALNASVAEHWLYLPSIGFLLFLVGIGLDLPSPRGRVAPYLAGSLLAPGARRVGTCVPGAAPLTGLMSSPSSAKPSPTGETFPALAPGWRELTDTRRSKPARRRTATRPSPCCASWFNSFHGSAAPGSISPTCWRREATRRRRKPCLKRPPRVSSRIETSIRTNWWRPLKSLDVLEAGDPAWPQTPAGPASTVPSAVALIPGDLAEYGIMDRERDGHPRSSTRPGEALYQHALVARSGAPEHRSIGGQRRARGRRPSPPGRRQANWTSTTPRRSVAPHGFAWKQVGCRRPTLFQTRAVERPAGTAPASICSSPKSSSARATLALGGGGDRPGQITGVARRRRLMDRYSFHHRGRHAASPFPPPVKTPHQSGRTPPTFAALLAQLRVSGVHALAGVSVLL